jgi:CheY-like chemotaxis protein
MTGEWDAQGEPETAEPVGTARHTVLVVDDCPAMVLLLRMLFEENGYEVLQASNGREAIDAYTEHGSTDLIITDIDMPEMDGLALCHWLRDRGSGEAVIMISGLDLSPELVRELQSSLDGFLQKPFSMEHLLEMAVAVMT